MRTKETERLRQKALRAKWTPEQRKAANKRDYLKKLSHGDGRDKLLKRLKEYRQKNPGKFNEYKANRRARKLAATPKWVDRAAIKNVYRLAEQEKRLTGNKVQVDHIVPLKSNIVCGLHVHYNLQITGDIYNNRKSNKIWPDMP